MIIDGTLHDLYEDSLNACLFSLHVRASLSRSLSLSLPLSASVSVSFSVRLSVCLCLSPCNLDLCPPPFVFLPKKISRRLTLNERGERGMRGEREGEGKGRREGGRKGGREGEEIHRRRGFRIS